MFPTPEILDQGLRKPAVCQILSILDLVGHEAKMIFYFAKSAFTVPGGISISYFLVKSQSLRSLSIFLSLFIVKESSLI